jgi:malonate-semialdehyde dehydrogenase (acetylating)/methylmalonate-semialdehyde dehydrogenase
MTLVNIPEEPFVCRNLIGGQWQDPSGREQQDVLSPYTGQKIGTVPLSAAEDASRAVEAAREAQREWGRTPAKERAQRLFRYREAMLRDLDELGNAVALECGKTFAEGRAGVLKGLEVVEYALSLQNLDQGGALEVSRGVTCELRREPLGVVAGVSPFNFPAMVPMWMFPIAVAVGNAFVLKPSEKVPITACMMGERMIEAGFPAGIFSVLHGTRPAVEGLIDDSNVPAIGFVGSSKVARDVYTRATGHGKRALALGGAKNHLIVAPDADPKLTVDGVVASFTACAGQRCMAGSLLVAVGDCDSLVDQIIDRASKVELGKDMGAIIDRAALDKLQGDIARAEEQGAQVRLDGRGASAPAGYEGGHWLGPTVLDHAKPAMDCASKELFGPILTIVRVDTLDEALQLENASPYGNATALFTSRGAVARHVAERASNGMIGVNVGVPVPREPFSFGGTKESRFGHGDITGQGGVDFWSQLKKITSKWALQPDQNWMA